MGGDKRGEGWVEVGWRWVAAWFVFGCLTFSSSMRTAMG